MSAEDLEAEKALMAGSGRCFQCLNFLHCVILILGASFCLTAEARALNQDGDEETNGDADLEVPMLIRNKPEGWLKVKNDDEKYKIDMESRPVTTTACRAVL